MKLMRDTGDFLDLIGNAAYQRAPGVLVHSRHLPDEFFDLKSGIAGEYLQKLSNYGVKAAFVIENEHLNHPRFREMVGEANRQGLIAYFTDSVEAGSWLEGSS